MENGEGKSVSGIRKLENGGTEYGVKCRGLLVKGTGRREHWAKSKEQGAKSKEYGVWEIIIQ